MQVIPTRALLSNININNVINNHLYALAGLTVHLKVKIFFQVSAKFSKLNSVAFYFLCDILLKPNGFDG